MERGHLQPFYTCPDCGVDFPGSSAAARTRHLTSHGKILYWKCPFCSRVESSHRYSDLAAHMTSIHGETKDAEPILLPISEAEEPEQKKKRPATPPRRRPSPRSTTRRRRSPRAHSPRRTTRPHTTTRRDESSSTHHRGSYTHHARHDHPLPAAESLRRPPSTSVRQGSLDRAIERLRSPALSQSPPPTGTRLPAEVGGSSRRRKSASPRKCPATAPALTVPARLPVPSPPPRLLSPVHETPGGPTSPASTPERETPAREDLGLETTHQQTSQPAPSEELSPPARQVDQLPSTSQETPEASDPLPSVEQVLSMLQLASPGERALIHEASAPDSVSVGVEANLSGSVHLLWGPDQTIVVQAGTATFRTRAPSADDPAED